MVPVNASFVSYVDLNALPEGDPIRQGRPLAQGQAVTQVPTNQAARRLAERSEHSQGASRLSQLMPCLAPPLEWIKRLLGIETVTKPKTFEFVGAVKRELPPDIAQACFELANNESVQVLSCAQELVAVDGADLTSLHEKLKRGSKGGDGIRRLVTSMSNLALRGPIGFRVQLRELLDKTAGGLAFSQWGTSGPQGPELFLSQASAESLATAAREINQIATQVLQLKGDIESLQVELKKSAGLARLDEQTLEGGGKVLRESAEQLAEPERVQAVVQRYRPVVPRFPVLDNMLADMASRVGRMLRPPRPLEVGSGSGWGMVADKERGFRPIFREDFAMLVDDLQSVEARDQSSRDELKRLLDEKIAGTRVLDWRSRQDNGDSRFGVEVREHFSEWAEAAIQWIEANKKDPA